MFLLKTKQNAPPFATDYPLVHTSEETLKPIKRVLGFNYEIVPVDVDSIPPNVKKLLDEAGVALPTLANRLDVVYDTQMDRTHYHFGDEWEYHNQGNGSTVRLIDKKNDKVYSVPPTFHEPLDQFVRSLERLLTGKTS